MKTNTKTNTRKLTLNGMFVAIYIVLEMFASVKLGNMKITFDALPIIISGMLFGPMSAVLVGALGCFISQLLTFGITLTTPLWILPAAVRGLIIGLYVKHKKFDVSQFGLSVVLVSSSIVITLLNTVSLYVDSKLYGYYSFVFVFGSLVTRLFAGIVTAVLLSLIAPVVVKAIKKHLNY